MAKATAAKTNPARETRQTVLQSGFAGAAAGVVAAALSSQPGAMAFDSLSQAVGMELPFGQDLRGFDGAFADTEPVIAPFTNAEIHQIREQLADSAEAIESSREATDPDIEFMRAAASRPGFRAFHNRRGG